GAVVTPPRQASGLGASAFDDAGFGFHGPCRVTGNAAGVANRGVDTAIGAAVSKPNISRRIHCGATHPSIRRVRGVSALLEYAESRIGGNGRAQLIPALPDVRSAGDRVVHHDRFVIAEVAESQAIHETVAQ